MAFSQSFIIKAIDQFSAITKKFVKQIKSNREALNKFSDALKKNRLKLAAFSLAIAGAFTISVVSAAKFEKGIANVYTLLDQPTLMQFSKELSIVQENAVAMGFGIEDASKALFDAISAGVQAGKANEFMANAQRLAIGGVTDLGIAVDGLTSIMNAYGKDTFDATKVANTFFTAQKFGKTTVGELAYNIGQIAPISKAAGISFQETASALATLTLSGLRTDLATTSLKNVIIGLLNPSKEAGKILKKLGIPFGTTELRVKGLGFALSQINKAYQQNANALTAIFPNIRAFLGAAGLSEEALKQYDMILKEVNADTVSLTNAFNYQNQTIARLFATFKGKLLVVLKRFGEELKPVLVPLFAFMNKFFDFLINLSPITKKAILLITGLIGAFSGILAVIGGLLVFKGVLATIGITIASITIPALAFMGFLVALSPLIVSLIKDFNDWRIVFEYINEQLDKFIFSIGKLISKIPFLGKVGNFLMGSPVEVAKPNRMSLPTAQEITTRAGLEANININAPRGVVKGITTKKTGTNFADLGLNLAES